MKQIIGINDYITNGFLIETILREYVEAMVDSGQQAQLTTALNIARRCAEFRGLELWGEVRLETLNRLNDHLIVLTQCAQKIN